MNWQYEKLGQLCEIQIGKTPARKEAKYWGEGYPWLSISDMKQGRFLTTTKESITDTAVKECRCKLVPKDTLLLSFKLSIGKLGFTRVPLYTNEAIAALYIKSEKLVFKPYLYWALQFVDLLQYVDSAVMGNTLNKKKLHQVEIPLPPLAEQKRIAAILDKADALRAKRRQAIAKLDSLLQATFLDMFGDPVTNPKNISKLTLNEITLNITDGKHGDCKPSENSGYYFVSVKDIKSGQIDYSNARQIDYDDFLEVHRRTRLEEGDVLITNSGTIGRTAVIMQSPLVERTTFQKSVAIVKPDKKKISSLYLRAALNMCVVNLTRVSSGSSQKNLLLRQLRNFEVCVPPFDQQHEFALRVQEIGRLETVHKQAFNKLDTLFHALQQQAFRGELSGAEASSVPVGSSEESARSSSEQYRLW
ncbi:restriction endonuclease subunit S [Anaerolineales bacterium HSG24]|nr:restriction endonuclease subunit S [Anaerolineales bacterium HSG24]